MIRNRSILGYVRYHLRTVTTVIHSRSESHTLNKLDKLCQMTLCLLPDTTHYNTYCTFQHYYHAQWPILCYSHIIGTFNCNLSLQSTFRFDIASTLNFVTKVYLPSSYLRKQGRNSTNPASGIPAQNPRRKNGRHLTSTSSGTPTSNETGQKHYERL